MINLKLNITESGNKLYQYNKNQNYISFNLISYVTMLSKIAPCTKHDYSLQSLLG